MAKAEVVKEKKLAVVSIYPEMVLTLHPEKFEYIKMDNGSHQKLRTVPDSRLQFDKHVAFCNESDLECLRAKFRYGTEFITVDDLRELERNPATKITASGIKNTMLRSSHRAGNPIGNDVGDVHDLIKDADDKAKTL